MKTKCSTCKYGGYNSCSDICDSCMYDPNTGYGGFYDHRVNKDFMTLDEQKEYYEKHNIWDDDDDDDDDDY